MAFARPRIELLGNPVALTLGHVFQGRAFRQVLTKQTVEILAGPLSQEW
jgi:hypothetical protein